MYFLDLLPSLSLLYDKILVPSPVRVQFLNPEREDAKAREVALTLLTAGGFFFQPCDNYDTVDVRLYLIEGLDSGESEALSQYKVTKADILLIDGVPARRIADLQGLRCRGTARILAEFEKMGLADTWDCIKKLRTKSRFKISNRIVEQALKESLESK